MTEDELRQAFEEHIAHLESITAGCQNVLDMFQRLNAEREAAAAAATRLEAEEVADMIIDDLVYFAIVQTLPECCLCYYPIWVPLPMCGTHTQDACEICVRKLRLLVQTCPLCRQPLVE